MDTQTQDTLTLVDAPLTFKGRKDSDRRISFIFESPEREDGFRTKLDVHVEHVKGRKGYYAGVTASQLKDGFERFTINFKVSRDNGILYRKVTDAPRYSATVLEALAAKLNLNAPLIALQWWNERFSVATDILEDTFGIPRSLQRAS